MFHVLFNVFCVVLLGLGSNTFGVKRNEIDYLIGAHIQNPAALE